MFLSQPIPSRTRRSPPPPKRASPACRPALARASRGSVARCAVRWPSLFSGGRSGWPITSAVYGVIKWVMAKFIRSGLYRLRRAVFRAGYTVSFIACRCLRGDFGGGAWRWTAGDPLAPNRSLEDAAGTFGISIALQQLSKNIFAQPRGRPMTSPDWLAGHGVYKT